MSAIDDLFGLSVLPGLSAQADVLGHAEEAELVARIDAASLMPFQFQGWTGKRLTASFGAKFDFARGTLETADPIPDWLLPLRTRVADFARLRSEDLSQALLIRYDPGAGIGWHRDRPVYDRVVGISLGTAATMRFRRRAHGGGFDRVGADLAPRSAYSLSGEARHGWEHSIAPLAQTRWSITFRSLSIRGRHPLAKPGRG